MKLKQMKENEKKKMSIGCKSLLVIGMENTIKGSVIFVPQAAIKEQDDIEKDRALCGTLRKNFAYYTWPSTFPFS